MRSRFFALTAMTSSLVFAGCGGSGVSAPALPSGARSIESTAGAHALAVKNVGDSYHGTGTDSVLGPSVYALDFKQSKASLTGILVWRDKTTLLQTKLKGSATAHGYSVKATGPCTGTDYGRVTPDGDGLSGIYKLTCGGTLHTGGYGLEKA